MSFFQKKLNKQKEKDFQERVKAYIDDLNSISQKHKIGMKPIITRYGTDVEFYDLQQAGK